MGRLARGSLATIGLIFLVTRSRSAHAQGALPISVEREAGAEDCPDTKGLVAAVTATMGHAQPRDALPYQVSFGRTVEAFTAAIRADADGSIVRHLEAREPTCAALAHATAVTLAVLFDVGPNSANPAAPSATPPAAASPRPPAPTPRPPAPTPPPSPNRSRAVEPLLSLGAAALVGVLRPVAPALVADAGLEVESWRASLSGLWALPQTVALPPGTVRAQLWAGGLRLCYAAGRGRALRLDLCSGALVGAATAQARGFTTNERHSALVLAFPVELALSSRARFIGWQLSGSALWLTPPNEFVVAGVGSVYRPAPIAGLFALRAFFAR